MSQVPCGLINDGATCYMNVVLQALFMTVKFRDHVLRKLFTSTSPEEKLLKALGNLFSRLQHEQTAVSTREVTKALNIMNVWEQQDAAEYLQNILNKMPESSEIFRGIMITSTKCLKCKNGPIDETDFLSIPLSVGGKCTVEYFVTEFLKTHNMSGDDRLYCSTCCDRRDMETNNEIKKWPDILMLQLKRFEMAETNTGFTHRKNACNVKIPFILKVQLATYELYAIIHHHGTYNGGHYDARIKDEAGIWYNFNDEFVEKVPRKMSWTDSKSSRSAYLLMYRKEEASTRQTEETNGHRSRSHSIKGRRLSFRKPNALKNPEHKTTKSGESTKRHIENQSSVSASLSKSFKLRLKEEFQYLNKEISPGERQNLNDVFIEPHITEEPDSHISEKREIKWNMINKIRTILSKGDAGTGKTVTVKKFILDWAEEKSNTHIDYIFLIPFQKLNIIRETVKECSFMQLLQRCFENTEYLTLHDSDGIMLILDGLNEFKLLLDFQNTKRITDINKPASVSDLLTNLIKGNLLPNAQIWITSRPAAANQIPAEYINRVTEIQGFDDQQKEEYFRKSISDQRMSEHVISHIQKSPRISSMCYLPDYCRIIAAIPEKMFSTGRDDFPKTLTQMYSRLLLAQIKLKRERRETIIALGRIAFHLLVNRNSLFCYEDLKKCGFRDESDLIRSSIIKKIEDKSKRTSFCFVNHRAQEFLAALYVTEVINVNNPLQLRDLSSLKLEFGKENFTDYYSLQKVMDFALQRQMDLFFCFLLGLTLESSQRALKDLLTQRRSSSSCSQLTVQHIKTLIMKSSPENTDKFCLLVDALKELDERYLIQQIKTQLKSGLRLSPAQFSALVFVLLNSEEQMNEIKSNRSEERSLKFRPVVKTFGDFEVFQSEKCVKICADLRSDPSHLRELDFSRHELGLSRSNKLSALLADRQCKLEKLGLRSCKISYGGCANLISALRSNLAHLRELDLSGNDLTDLGVNKLSVLLQAPQCKLEKLVLRSCKISDGGCADLISALRSNLAHLRELDLSGNYLTDVGVKKLLSSKSSISTQITSV